MQGYICPHPPLLIPEVGGASLRRVNATVTPMTSGTPRWGRSPRPCVGHVPHSDGYRDATSFARRRACAVIWAASAALVTFTYQNETCPLLSCCWLWPATIAAWSRARGRR